MFGSLMIRAPLTFKLTSWRPPNPMFGQVHSPCFASKLVLLMHRIRNPMVLASLNPMASHHFPYEMAIIGGILGAPNKGAMCEGNGLTNGTSRTVWVVQKWAC